MTHTQLLEMAEKARERAYAPYSGFCVGAALLADDGSVYIGCNVENASYTPTCCAERVAVFTAIADGKRGFSAIAVSGGKAGEKGQTCYPCGVCRQVPGRDPEKSRCSGLRQEHGPGSGCGGISGTADCL